MKVANKKPGHEFRGKSNMLDLKNCHKYGIKHGTLVYPEGSPMRRYKDAKKVAKQK